MDMTTVLAEIEDTIHLAEARLQVEQERADRITSELERLTTLLEAKEQLQGIVQKLAAEIQNSVRLHLESLVQLALNAVFPKTYIFHLDFVEKRGRTEAEITLERDGDRVNPIDAAGGGVVDVVALALRLAAWGLSNTSPVLVLDEPFRFVSKGLRSAVQSFLLGLSQQLGVQVIMVTHDQELMTGADKLFLVEQRDGRSTVQEAS